MQLLILIQFEGKLNGPAVSQVNILHTKLFECSLNRKCLKEAVLWK